MKLKAAFMPYVCLGDPSEEFSLKLIETLVNNGADALELGIPFSDPIADGKTIQEASARALKNGMNPEKAIHLIKKIREKGISVPITVMTYYNIVYNAGIEKFVKSLKENGADALLVPDAPIEESEELHGVCEKNGVDLVYLVAPNTSEERLKKIADECKGFLYAVSLYGTTGAKEKVSDEAIELVKRAKKECSLPVAVGFGISKPEHASEIIKAGADGVIIGSELINRYRKYDDEEKALEDIAEFTRDVKKACEDLKG